MKHLGDITKISGYSVPIVDCIIGGSPCQDLSVAGKRAGLDGERSGLYMEQIRIVKEMREQDERNGRSGVDIRPRYMVWENVPRAFSSNKGEDFRIVLEEIAKVCDKDAVIPMPDKGKWTNCGCIMGDGWSVAWRVLDSQFWGVPQRRRRIALVADFGGQSAPEILFVRKSVSGDIEPSKPKRKDTASDASGGIGADDSIGVDVFNGNLTQDKVISLVASGNNSTGYSPKVMIPVTTAYTMQDREGCAGGGKGALIQKDRSAALRTVKAQYLFQPVLALDRASFNQGKNAQFDFEVSDKGINSPLVAKGPGAVCYGIDQQGGKGCANYTEDVAPTILSDSHGTPHAVCYSIDQGGGKSSVDVREDKAPTLTTTHDGAPAVCYSFNPTASRDAGDYILEGVANPLINGTCPGHKSAVCYWDGGQVTGTLTANNAGGNQRMPDKENFNCVITRYIVRRLTPLECERLQGYPDGWTDIGEYIDTNGKKKQSSDAARYKALGNSIALPPWKWVLKRLCACYERDATMASLFDGIGGFPYLWEQLNGKGSCLWASEIEEFPMAVTKARIGE